MSASPAHSEMTREELEEAIIAHANEQTTRLLRWIIWMVVGGCGSILIGGVAWGDLRTKVTNNSIVVSEVRSETRELSQWRQKIDATHVSPREVGDLDKRLARLEDQNAAILQQLIRIDGRLK